MRGRRPAAAGGCRLQAARAGFPEVSDSNVRYWHVGLGSALGTSVAWCFPVSHVAVMKLSTGFLEVLESNVRQCHVGLGSALRTSVAWCFRVSHAAAKAVGCRLPELVF
jgi:hypothetical protein